MASLLQCMRFALNNERDSCIVQMERPRSMPTITLMTYCWSWWEIVMICWEIILLSSAQSHNDTRLAWTALPPFYWQGWISSLLSSKQSWIKPTKLSLMISHTQRIHKASEHWWAEGSFTDDLRYLSNKTTCKPVQNFSNNWRHMIKHKADRLKTELMK